MTQDTSEQSSQPFNFETENIYLKLTITALRNQIEKLQINQEEKNQKTKSDSADEISQLQNTVNALRSEMEKSQISKEEEIQNAVTHANNQNKQLRGTVNNLRDKLQKTQNHSCNYLLVLNRKY